MVGINLNWKEFFHITHSVHYTSTKYEYVQYMHDTPNTISKFLLLSASFDRVKSPYERIITIFCTRDPNNSRKWLNYEQNNIKPVESDLTLYYTYFNKILFTKTFFFLRTYHILKGLCLNVGWDISYLYIRSKIADERFEEIILIFLRVWDYTNISFVRLVNGLDYLRAI